MIAFPGDILTFWREAGPEKWFRKDTAFDDAIRSRFLETYEAAAAGLGGVPHRAATDDDWSTEFLSLVLAVRVVDDLDAALAPARRMTGRDDAGAHLGEDA